MKTLKLHRYLKTAPLRREPPTCCMLSVPQVAYLYRITALTSTRSRSLLSREIKNVAQTNLLRIALGLTPPSKVSRLTHLTFSQKKSRGCQKPLGFPRFSHSCEELLPPECWLCWTRPLAMNLKANYHLRTNRPLKLGNLLKRVPNLERRRTPREPKPRNRSLLPPMRTKPSRRDLRKKKRRGKLNFKFMCLFWDVSPIRSTPNSPQIWLAVSRRWVTVKPLFGIFRALNDAHLKPLNPPPPNLFTEANFGLFTPSASVRGAVFGFSSYKHFIYMF